MPRFGQQGVESRRYRRGFRATPFGRFSAEPTQQGEQLRHIPVTPGFPLLSSSSGQMPCQCLHHLVYMRRDHLLFDLLPMFQPLDLWPYARQLNGPGEEIGGGHAFSRELNGRGDGLAILLFKLRNGSTLSIEVHWIAIERKIRQSKHAALFRRHGIERTIDEHCDPFPLCTLQYCLPLIRAGIGRYQRAGLIEIHGALQRREVVAI